MDKDLIAASQMFLLPASILFTALGVAQTEGLKTGVSTIAFVISGAWFWRVWVWDALPPADWKAALAFSGIFALASLVSLCVHGLAFAGERGWIAKQARLPQSN
jgi:hypothetical protein